MDTLSKENIQLSNSVFKHNVNALISIYYDSEKIRLEKVKEILSAIKDWSEANKGKEIQAISNHPPQQMDEYNLYQYQFEFLLLNSLFISAFSLFEVHLKRLAKLTEKGKNSKIKLSDIKGNGEIDTIRKYLFLIHDLKNASHELPEWKELLEFKAIRNAIVHHGNILNADKKADLQKVLGYNKLQQHGVWISSDSIHFRIKKISFLENFRDVSIRYSDNLTTELIDTC